MDVVHSKFQISWWAQNSDGLLDILPKRHKKTRSGLQSLHSSPKSPPNKMHRTHKVDFRSYLSTYWNWFWIPDREYWCQISSSKTLECLSKRCWAFRRDRQLWRITTSFRTLSLYCNQNKKTAQLEVGVYLNQSQMPIASTRLSVLYLAQLSNNWPFCRNCRPFIFVCSHSQIKYSLL